MNKLSLLEVLKKVKSLGFRIESDPDLGPAVAWGKGFVEVKQEEDMLIFLEEGTTQLTEEIQSQFSNSYYWKYNAEERSITHGHMRQGTSNPTELVELRPISKTHYSSADPHLCGPDTYIAEVFIKDDYILSEWKVSGPNKDYSKRIYYCFTDEFPEDLLPELSRPGT